MRNGNGSSNRDEGSARERITDALGSPENAVAMAWDVVKKHPLASLGAVAAGVGAYVLISHFESDGSSSRSSRGDGAKARGGRGRRGSASRAGSRAGGRRRARGGTASRVSRRSAGGTRAASSAE
jgi:hypothetical protein